MEGVSFFAFFGEFQVFELGLARAGLAWPGLSCAGHQSNQPAPDPKCTFLVFPIDV